jgi:hypothetical protein
MARVGRLAGALLAETRTDVYLIGNTKRPCDWDEAGFESPGEIDALRRPTVRLNRRAAIPVPLPGPWLAVEMEGEPLARMLANRFLIERNGSVSDRLWRLVMRDDPDGDDPPSDAVVDGRWLVELPPHVWDIVRERVLRCT